VYHGRAARRAGAQHLADQQSGVALHLIDEQPPRAPTAGLARLDDLVSRAEAAGVVVSLDISGEPNPLPASIDLAAFRIVQESLTNIIRHAGSGTATVTLIYGSSELTVQVDDDGRGADGSRSGSAAGAGEAGDGERDRGDARAGDRAPRIARRGSVAGRRLPRAGPTAALAGGRAMIRVVLADDQELVRAGFQALLDAQDGISVIGAAADGREAVELARKLKPDVILMDIRMPVLDGLQATNEIASDGRLNNVRILILTTFELDEYVFDAIRAGAAGFLVKDTKPADLIEAVRVVGGGEALLSPSVTRTLIAEFAARAKQPPSSAALDELTDREHEVMALAAGGLSNEQIAQRLVVSVATAKTHVSRAMVKLGVRDRAQLVVLAYETGLVRPGWLE
jgi:DNA-binding NarL/FixJ family response regulator